MAVTTHKHRKEQLVSLTQPKSRQQAALRASSSLVVPGIKASLVGGFGLFMLTLLSLIPPPSNLPVVTLAILVIPGYLIVCLVTGLLAGIYAEDQIKSSQHGGQVGWIAGFWAGIFGAILAMIMAGQGILMVEFGRNVAEQFASQQLMIWGRLITPDKIALAGRILGACLVYGLLGSLLSALLSSIAGMIYLRLRDS